MKHIWLLLPILFVIGCGIDEVPVLNPPKYPITESQFFRFTSDPQSNEYFQGFEIYYKFYQDRAIAAVEADEVRDGDNIGQIDRAKAKQFRRLSSSDDMDVVNRPLIKIPIDDREGAVEFTIYFETYDDVYITAVPQDSNGNFSLEKDDLIVYRAIKNGDGTFKTFADIQIADDDVKGLIIPGSLYLSLFVFSYGIYNLSTVLHSEAIWLNTIEIVVSL